MSETNSIEKGPNEQFCRSCGAVIKQTAEICPECGVRNEAKEDSTQQPSPTHNPSQHNTTVSNSWYAGIIVGMVLWILLFGLAGAEASGAEALLGFAALIAWAIMPIAAYFDMKYIRANSAWNPNTILWTIVMAVWLVNLIAGLVYLYRRHEYLGEP